MRVLAFIEAATVTGPTKNLIRFARWTRTADAGPAKIEVSIAAFDRRKEDAATATNLFVEAARADGLSVEVIRERFRFDSAVIPQMRALVRRHTPDIVQSHGVKAHFLLHFSRLARGRRWIAFHHGYTAEDAKMKIYNRLNRWSLPLADRVVTVCSPFRDVLVGEGVDPRRIRILPNAVEPCLAAGEEAVRAVRMRLGIAPAEQVILSVGRLSPEKGHRDLIAAFSRVAGAHSGRHVRLVLVGDGIERQRLADFAARKGVADGIVFAGHNAEVQPFYRMADLFVLPSYSEGSPNVILEAMASGLPIVATSVGGVPETVEHDSTALLVPPGNVEVLAEAMCRLLLDREFALRLGRDAKTSVVARFSPDAYNRRLMEIYDESSEALR